MSQENVEIVRWSWRAFADRGISALEWLRSKDINWRSIEGAPDDVWVGGLIARLTISVIDEARAAAERLARERG